MKIRYNKKLLPFALLLLMSFAACASRLVSGHQLNGAQAAPRTDSSNLKLWDTASGNLLRTFRGHTSEVRSVAFSTNGKVIVSGSLDGTMKLWSPNNDEPLASLITMDKTDWVVVTPDDHFDATPGAEKLLHFVATLPEGQYKIIPLAELKSSHYEMGLLQRLLKGGV